MFTNHPFSLDHYLENLTSSPTAKWDKSKIPENLKFKEDSYNVIHWLQKLTAWEGELFDLERLFYLLNLQVEEIDCDNSKCRIRKEKEIWIISISQFIDNRRQRYALTYALGHILFHTKKIKKEYNVFPLEKKTGKEQEARDFALALLMPVTSFSYLSKEVKKNIKLEQELSDLSFVYNVPYEAIGCRAEQLHGLLNIERTKTFSFWKITKVLKHLFRVY
jgi:Zn-dependent peptidase ImmA (M78 family)